MIERNKSLMKEQTMFYASKNVYVKVMKLVEGDSFQCNILPENTETI